VRLAACAVLVVLAAGCGGGDDPRSLIAANKTAVVRGSLTPNVHLFAEPIVARVEVILNRTKADPGSVRVKTDFAPYEPVSEPRTTRTDIGDFTLLRYSVTLNCLSERCIPRTASGEATVGQRPGLPPFLPGKQRDENVKYQFEPAIVSLDAEPEDTTLGRVVWSPLRSLSRINWDDSSVVGQGFPFVAEVAPPPEPSYRVPPALLGLGLLLLAAALLALPVWLVWRRRARRAPPRADERLALSPLERALALVEWASRRPSVDDRREALEALAFELDADARAAQARAQGWSPPMPELEEMTELVTSIRETDAPAT